ncbi:hypothetical protein V9T40_005838 [Parthenolecanium corni]|uniref:Endonuclease/exonuclease/phosphatase domain-containing protein n=1 Tax=Parthenolecanium corni TaxID=536013 RepID=A0AAN9YB36_9HEMI
MKVCFLILCLNLSACFCAKTVADFSFITWNTEGGRWNAAKQYFLTANVDLMAIQAAGELPHEPSSDGQAVFKAVPEADSVPTLFLGATTAKPAFIIEQYLWNLTDNDQIHLYYYANPNALPKRVHHSRASRAGHHNLAILSRHKAHKLFALAADDGAQTEPSVHAVRRPLMAMRIESALFLNFHADDDEATAVIEQVTNVTAAHYPTLTWALTGDFNRTPADLAEGAAKLNAPPNNTFRRIVAAGVATRVPRPWDKKNRSAPSKRKYRKHRRNHQHRQPVIPRPLLEANNQTHLLTAAAPLAAVERRNRAVDTKYRRHLRAAASRRPTRKNRKAAAFREVDYAVLGGPATSRHIVKAVSVELLKNYFANAHIRRYPRNSSHHLPLIFNKQL